MTLKPVIPPMTWKLEEFIDQNQNHEAPYESLASSGVQLALQNHQPQGFLCFVTCTVQLGQCLEIHAAGNWFFLCQNIFIHTSPSIKIISKKSKYTSDLESKQCPIQFPLFCCSTEQEFYYTKIVQYFCLQNFNQIICNTMHLAMVAMSGYKLLHIVTTDHQQVLQEFNEIIHIRIPPTLHLDFK